MEQNGWDKNPGDIAAHTLFDFDHAVLIEIKGHDKDIEGKPVALWNVKHLLQKKAEGHQQRDADGKTGETEIKGAGLQAVTGAVKETKAQHGSQICKGTGSPL